MSTNESSPDFKELFKRSLTKIADLKERLETSEAARNEPIAIIGLGCRFPGGGVNPEAYWQALQAGVDGVKEIPAERWSADALPAADAAVRWAALLDSVDGFDAAFFGISPREATSLDPQQRLLLEVVWEALESAGQRPDSLLNTRTGVFAGICNPDYRQLILHKDLAELDVYDCTGNMQSMATGRVSYVLGLQGPCISVDTACSSSLVAVHLACQSLRSGECELAIAGGVNVIVDPTTMLLTARTLALSPDGRCKTFDARANGFVRGEGCGVVILKRLSAALRDHDPIQAVIRGSAVNQDGRATGLTAPNVLAQQAMLQQALASAGVAATEIGYVETHGTGTALGDPIEVEALKAVLGAQRADAQPLVLGAVKSNVGHLEAAAGVAGLIKAVLCLTHQAIPGNLHFQALNPRIELAGTPLVIPTQTLPWLAGPRQRLAGVSSFGMSGTNAHLILAEAPPAIVAAAPAAPSAQILTLSAQSPDALRMQAKQYAEHLLSHPETKL